MTNPCDREDCSACADPLCGCDCHRPARLPGRALALIGASTAALVACSGGAAQIAEPHPGVVVEPHPMPDTAPPSPEPETTTTEATTPGTTATASPPAMPPITVATVAPPATVAEPTFEEEAEEWWEGERERSSVLACIRRWEQDADGYASVSNDGVYRGAYQFDQPTWDGVVGQAGYPQWVGKDPATAPPHVQDDAAWLLYQLRGLQPWPTPQAMC